MAPERRSDDWAEAERRPPACQLHADEILRLLLEATVDFVVIGGLAVGAHGFVRATKDVDIVQTAATGRSKRVAGRPQDLIDLEQLRQLHGDA